MKMSTETRVHPETGKLLKRGIRSTVVRYKGLERTVELPGWYPEDDDDGIISGLDARIADEALHEMKAEIANLPKPEEVRRIRQRLKLSQRRASEVLGGGARAFQKYESGEIVVSRPMANLLRLLDQNPSLLKKLIADRAA
jgi:HTH-type transcriptional regulator/antitoxin MqsA